MSERELEVLRLMAEGLSNLEISEHMHIAFETAKSHVRAVLSCLDARNRTHAVALAFRAGIIE